MGRPKKSTTQAAQKEQAVIYTDYSKGFELKAQTATARMHANTIARELEAVGVELTEDVVKAAFVLDGVNDTNNKAFKAVEFAVIGNEDGVCGARKYLEFEDVILNIYNTIENNRKDTRRGCKCSFELLDRYANFVNGRFEYKQDFAELVARDAAIYAESEQAAKMLRLHDEAAAKINELLAMFNDEARQFLTVNKLFFSPELGKVERANINYNYYFKK